MNSLFAMTGSPGKMLEIDIFVLNTAVKTLPTRTIACHTRGPKSQVQHIQARCPKGVSEQFHPSDAGKGAVSTLELYNWF